MIYKWKINRITINKMFKMLVLNNTKCVDIIYIDFAKILMLFFMNKFVYKLK